jgi:hypothetical protein
MADHIGSTELIIRTVTAAELSKTRRRVRVALERMLSLH